MKVGEWSFLWNCSHPTKMGISGSIIGECMLLNISKFVKRNLILKKRFPFSFLFFSNQGTNTCFFLSFIVLNIAQWWKRILILINSSSWKLGIKALLYAICCFWFFEPSNYIGVFLLSLGGSSSFQIISLSIPNTLCSLQKQ